mgnify:CR=1 FL=1
MQRAKIVLNTQTWFKDGSHDRIYNGMLANAAVISDESVFLRDTFKNHKEIELFALRDIMNLPDITYGLLKDEIGRAHV